MRTILLVCLPLVLFGLPLKGQSPASPPITFHDPFAGLRVLDDRYKIALISRSGTWANRFMYGLNLPDFLKTAQSSFDKEGLCVTDLETYEEDGQVKWAAVLRSGDWANSMKYDLSAPDFQQETQNLFDKEGLRLIKAITYLDGGQRQWAGICTSGDWASSFTPS